MVITNYVLCMCMLYCSNDNEISCGRSWVVQLYCVRKLEALSNIVCRSSHTSFGRESVVCGYVYIYTTPPPPSREAYMHFQSCRSVRDVKQVFNTVSKQLHPDKGGNHEAFVKLYEEYTAAKKRWAGVGVASNAEEPEEDLGQPFAETEPPRNSKRRWTKWTIEAMWAWMARERKINEASINRQNAASLQRENDAWEAQLGKPSTLTPRQQLVMCTDYDRKGHVGELLTARKNQNQEGLLAEMARKRKLRGMRGTGKYSCPAAPETMSGYTF